MKRIRLNTMFNKYINEVRETHLLNDHGGSTTKKIKLTSLFAGGLILLSLKVIIISFDLKAGENFLKFISN